MLRRSARRSGQAPPEDTPADTPPPAKRGRGGGRGRGRGRGKSVPDSMGDVADDANQDGAAQDTSLEYAAESQDDCAADAAEELVEPAVAFPILEELVGSAAMEVESDKPEESSNHDDNVKEAGESRNEERAREEGSERRSSDDRRRQPQDGPNWSGHRDEESRGGGGSNWGERNEEGQRPPSRDRPQSRDGGGRRRRSRSREEYDAEYDDRRRGGRGPPPPFRGGHYGHPNDGYGRGGGGYGPPGPPGPPWGYGRGRGRGGPPGFRGGWRGRGDFGGPHGHHPGMMGPPPGWGDNGYDQMGGPHGPPHMMPPHMRGPGGPPGPHGPPPPHGHYGPPPGHPGHPGMPHQQPPPPPPQMMGGVGPPPGMGVPPPHGIPPLPPGPPPPPAPPANEMENVKTEEEMAAMKEQIARQIEEAREKALVEKKEEQREEKVEEKSEDTEKRKKQASAMFRAARLNKSTVAAAASSNKAAAAAAAAVAAVAPVGVPPPASMSTSSSTPQPVPPPSLTVTAPLGVATRAAAKKQETRDVFGRDDDGGLFGERKATLSLPTAADRAEMQLYNDVLNAPHPSQDSLSPRKAPAPVPPPICTPATTTVSKPSSGSGDRRDDQSRERRSRSRSREGERERERRESRSPRRDRSPFSTPSSRRDRSPRSRSRSPRRSPKSSPRRERRGRSRTRSRSRSHGRHRSRTRSRSKERGGRSRHDSGHYRRAGSPAREQRSTRRRAYDLSPVRNSGGRSGHRRARGESKSPRRERSRSRERKRSPDWSRKTRRGREEEREREERERRRSGGEGRDEKRRKGGRKDSGRSKENGEGSEDEGKENSTPGHDEMEIDKVMDEDTVEKKITVADAPKDAVSIDGEKECSKNATVSGAAAPAAPAAVAVAQPRPEPYQEITESIFHAQIKDRNDYGGECICTDGECGVSCVLRYLTVECGRKCPSGDGCQNKAMQKTKGSRVEVFHTGTEKGFGVRALEPIKKGGFIIEYLGEVVTHKQGEKRKKQYARESPTRRHHYLMTVTDWQNRPFIIDATKYGNCSRFLNHSCEPNAICDKWSVKRCFRMGFFAGRNIEAGEEITFDYRFQNYGRSLIECACGAAKCRKYLASKDNVKEEEERQKASRERSEENSSEDTDEDETEEEEEEEEVEIKEEDRKKLRKQQSIIDEAERLLKKGILSKKGQFELLSAVMMRLTPAHQSLRSRLVALLYASGEKNNEAYRVFLNMNGRMILQKYLTLGVDEETTVSQYRELIPLLEALLELLEGIKQYTETTRQTSVMANLVPLLRAISAQSEVPDGLVVFEVLHDIVSGVEEEATEEEEEGEWTKRWVSCTGRASQLAETWKFIYSLNSTFKIPKKREEKNEERRASEGAVKPSAPAVSMIRPASFSRSIKTDSPAGAGWQSLNKDRRDSRDFYSKDRFPADRLGGGGYRKRKYEDESGPGEKREYGGFRREERRDEKEEKSAHSATNSSESQEEDAMQISPNLDESESRTGEPEMKKANYGASDFSPLPSFAAGQQSRPDRPPSAGLLQQQQLLHQQHLRQLQLQQARPHHEQVAPGPMPPHAAAQWGGAGAPPTAANHWGWQHPAAAAAAAAGGGGQQHWGMSYGGGYPNGLPPAVATEGMSYFRLAPAPGSSLTDELTFWTGAVKYCQLKADEIQHRLDQANQLEQQQNLQQLQHKTVAAEVPLVAAVASPAAPKEEKPPRPPLNDRLAELTGVPIKKGGGGGSEEKEKPVKKEKKHSPPRPPYRPSDEEIAAAKNVRTKDGRLILISSIAKYCKVHTETGAIYYYNKITRSPTWDLPEGEEANSEDELEVASSSGAVMGGGASVDSSSASASRSSTTTAGKTPTRGRPQTPPEEPADPISTHEMTEKEKLQRKSEFKTRSGELLKRYVKASMFNDVDDFKRTLRKIIHGCIEKEQKMNGRFDFSFSDDVKHRMVEYTKKYVQRHKLKPLSYPDGIAD